MKLRDRLTRCLDPPSLSFRLDLLIGLLIAETALAWYDADPYPPGDEARRLMVTDGSYVMNIGELQINITNHGLIGSQYSILSSYSDAPSGQWPSGSGDEYLFAAGLWVGGRKGGDVHVSTGQEEREFRPLAGPESTIYEARYGAIVRPRGASDRGGAREFEPGGGGDDDLDGRVNEETLNGFDDDGDGLIDEDFAMFGSQMMVCTMYDNTPIAAEIYPDHVPLDLKVVQTVFAWETGDVDDFVIFRYDISNIGLQPIEDVYLGMLVDCDIGPRSHGENAFNDLVGRFTGAAQASNGLYERVDVAYMHDGEGEDRIPGYFGIMFQGANSGQRAIRSFQHYTGVAPYAMGGAPLNDAERYQEMAKTRSDLNVSEGRGADYRLLVSSGPRGTLFPGATMRFEVAFVCGDGLEGLLENCVNAYQTWEGAWYDMDRDPTTGVLGRETQICIDDLSDFSSSGLSQLTAAYVDASCYDEWAEHPVTFDDMTLTADGRYCIWVNMDNCDECERIRGAPCNMENFFKFWDCNGWGLSVEDLDGCTGVGGRETRINWITESAPRPPDMRLWDSTLAVHIYWNDDSEYERDLISGYNDFEGYKIWRAADWDRPSGTSEATGPPSGQWALLTHFDLINAYLRQRIYPSGTVVDTIPLGANTGLEPARYRPACLDDPRFSGLSEMMDRALRDCSPTDVEVRPSLRLASGEVRPGMSALLPWEAYPAVLDTFFWVVDLPGDALGGTAPKHGKTFYEFIDRQVRHGFLYFYAVTATDHFKKVGPEITILTGPGVEGDPSTNFAAIRPGLATRSALDPAAAARRVYVYPNPATRSVLAELQQMQPDGDDPTGVRIIFADLPEARNTVNIFTLNGDLVQVLAHDGTGGHGELAWNLVTRNGQQIVSGIYLFSVHSDNPAFRDQVGRFVVIR